MCKPSELAVGHIRKGKRPVNGRVPPFMSCLSAVEQPDDAPVVCLYSPMLRLPVDQAEQNRLLKQALQINLFSLETGAACLAYDARTETITLTCAVPLEALDAESFAEAVVDFIELSVDLNARFLALSQVDRIPSSSVPLPPHGLA